MSSEAIVTQHLNSLGLSGALGEFHRQINEPASLSLGFEETVNVRIVDAFAFF